jgi:hypothetical protein
MEFADKDLKCDTCGAEFVFSAGEQQFFQGRGFTNLPKHCKRCQPKRAGRGRSTARNTCEVLCLRH